MTSLCLDARGLLIGSLTVGRVCPARSGQVWGGTELGKHQAACLGEGAPERRCAVRASPQRPPLCSTVVLTHRPGETGVGNDRCVPRFPDRAHGEDTGLSPGSMPTSTELPASSPSRLVRC